MLGICKVSVPYPGLKQVYFSFFPPSKLVLLSQKYPKAPFSEVLKILQGIKGTYKECCEGDMVECMDDRVS